MTDKLNMVYFKEIASGTLLVYTNVQEEIQNYCAFGILFAGTEMTQLWLELVP